MFFQYETTSSIFSHFRKVESLRTADILVVCGQIDQFLGECWPNYLCLFLKMVFSTYMKWFSFVAEVRSVLLLAGQMTTSSFVIGKGIPVPAIQGALNVCVFILLCPCLLQLVAIWTQVTLHPKTDEVLFGVISPLPIQSIQSFASLYLSQL